VTRAGLLALVAVTVLSLALAALGAAPLQAAEEPAHGEQVQGEQLHGEQAHAAETFLGLPKWIWMTANLILFLGLLGYYVGPAIRDFLDTRAKEISASLALAKDQQREVEEMKSLLESQIAALESEMDEVLVRAREEGDKERQEILVQAERERARLLEQTAEEIRLRLRQAKKELTQHTARLATDLARQRLEQSMTADDRHRLFDENLERLEREVQ